MPLFCRFPTGNADPNVGAGLLAKASCQSTSTLNDTPPSRASPLPHLNWGVGGKSSGIKKREPLRSPVFCVPPTNHFAW
ncbi:hypothetical protein EAH78_10110 [Pseudomonas arsenicoxydans]|uniref:Uncharacterized protein n=1 Tax=Pseudomonas arsenicoxydans TaxID=702115 RepID=A0A502I0M9_9PSED|nr:hypothetical protein EAH78_10110 [Pseudomonas arsenicoxydans]